MADGFDIQAPPVSPLLAMGTGPRFNRRWLIGIVAGLVPIVTLIVMTLLFSINVPLPEQTLFLVTVSPKTANQLFTSSQRATLPPEWQRALSTDSRWPVVFGLRGSKNNLRAFAIGPRWAVPTVIDAQTDTYGLVRQIGEQLAISQSDDLSSLVYRETVFDQLFSDAALEGWANASPLFPNSSSSNRIGFSFTDGHLILTDTISALESEHELTGAANGTSRPLQTDLSLHLSALHNLNNSEGFLGELPLAPLTTTLTALRALPTTLSVDLASSTLERVDLSFREPLSEQERAALQTNLDQTAKRRVLTLPDGTLAVESVATSNSTPAEDPTRFQWSTSGVQIAREVTACSEGTWIARFSPDLLAQLVPNGPQLNEWLPQHALQVWRTHRSLVICLEI